MYGVDDFVICWCFFVDWGMKEVVYDDMCVCFEMLNGCIVLVVKVDDLVLLLVFEVGLMLCEVMWGVVM